MTHMPFICMLAAKSKNIRNQRFGIDVNKVSPEFYDLNVILDSVPAISLLIFALCVIKRIDDMITARRVFAIKN